MRIPSATYRLQLTPELGFAEARELIPYLASLGISDLYLSPIFAANPGSRHGYDVVDPRRPNPELGGRGELEALAGALEAEGMGLVLDIVPNHMAASVHNPWWRDVLEHGPASPFAGHFDIDWHAPSLPDGRLLLPVLGEPYVEAIAGDHLGLELNERGLEVAYHDRRFPLEPGSWLHLLGRAGEEAPADPVPAELREIFEDAARIPPFTATEPESVEERLRMAERLNERLRHLRAEAGGAGEWLQARLAALSSRRESGRVPRLHRLLSDQPYWLVHWRLASEEINYRRFFSISDLPAVRVEEPEVFDAVHELVLDLVREGIATGLRIDHIDGLRNPGGYLWRLSTRLREVLGSGTPGESESKGAGAAAPDGPGAAAPDGPGAASPDGPNASPTDLPLYTVVEKILAPGEELPGEWPVHGTSGYDFLGLAQGVLVDPGGLDELTRIHARVSPRADHFAGVSYRAKKEMLHELFGGELRALTRSFVRLARRDDAARDLPRRALVRALVEVTARLPVYRTYVRAGGVTDRDRALIEAAIDSVAPEPPAAESALRFLRRVLTLERPPSELRQAWTGFVADWQQLTGPVAAKGVEDTAFYRHDRLLALNEVGGEPDHLVSVGGFHRACRERSTRHPHSLNATSTHDTKRSEDARARLLVLSECPLAWERAVERWRELNGPRKQTVDGAVAPDAGEELHLYQALLAAWPLTSERGGAFADRMERYAVKALREARVHSSWEEPDDAYEAAVGGFLERILAPADTPFLRDFERFHRTIAPHGAMNSLAQALLAMAAPGVPDRYRGAELWDFSLVDPDNRRPVEFERRRRMLRYLERARTENPEGLANELTLDWRDGKIKLHLIAGALRLREERPGLFARGDYLPVSTAGERSDHVLAFARRARDAWALAAVPLRTLRLRAAAGEDGTGDELSSLLLPSELWDDTRLRLPEGAPREWSDVHTGRTLRAEDAAGGEAAGSESSASEGATLSARELFARFPFALLTA